MSFNFVKLKEQPTCPCGEVIKLPQTKTKRDNLYYIQSKHAILAGNQEVEPMNNFWFSLEEVRDGEIHAVCPKCKAYIEFEIKNGEIIGSKPRR